jgi:hypothetical protein
MTEPEGKDISRGRGDGGARQGDQQSLDDREAAFRTSFWVVGRA